MSPESREVIVRCLISEIEAFERSIEATGPLKDAWGAPRRDVRDDYLKKLTKALDELRRA